MIKIEIPYMRSVGEGVQTLEWEAYGAGRKEKTHDECIT
jgi:hypothetical protein